MEDKASARYYLPGSAGRLMLGSLAQNRSEDDPSLVGGTYNKAVQGEYLELAAAMRYRESSSAICRQSAPGKCSLRLWAVASEWIDRGFRLQQNGNPVADRVHAFALIALQAGFAAEDKRLAANGTGETLQQIRSDHVPHCNAHLTTSTGRQPVRAVRLIEKPGARSFRLMTAGG